MRDSNPHTQIGYLFPTQARLPLSPICQYKDTIKKMNNANIFLNVNILGVILYYH